MSHKLGKAEAQNGRLLAERVENLALSALLRRVNCGSHKVVLQEDEQAISELPHRNVGIALQLPQRALRVADERSTNQLRMVAKMLPHHLKRS